MSGSQPKTLQNIQKMQEKTQAKETKQISELDSNMTQMELSDREFKIIIINVLRCLMENVDDMQKLMGNTGRKL